MLDLIQAVFADVLHGKLGVLDRNYVRDLAPEIVTDLQKVFDSQWETRFVLVDDAGNVEVNTTFFHRKDADHFARQLSQRTGKQLSVGWIVMER